MQNPTMLSFRPLGAPLSTHPKPLIMTITLFGIPNCDTVKKARVWLTDHQIDFVFHDFKKQGLTAEEVQKWLNTQSWEVLVNKKGTTWRNLTDAQKADTVDATSATSLMIANPSVIKRPILVIDGKAVQVGFSDALYQQIFK
jgi:arsenate reductase